MMAMVRIMRIMMAMVMIINDDSSLMISINLKPKNCRAAMMDAVAAAVERSNISSNSKNFLGPSNFKDHTTF